MPVILNPPLFFTETATVLLPTCGNAGVVSTDMKSRSGMYVLVSCALAVPMAGLTSTTRVFAPTVEIVHGVVKLSDNVAVDKKEVGVNVSVWEAGHVVPPSTEYCMTMEVLLRFAALLLRI